MGCVMLNRIVLIGRLTKDPELRHTQSGQQEAWIGDSGYNSPADDLPF